MTNPLEILKTQLEKSLNETTEPEGFKESLRDAVYCCQFGTNTALLEWVNCWVNPDGLSMIPLEDSEYQQGVQFVEEKWHQITGMF